MNNKWLLRIAGVLIMVLLSIVAWQYKESKADSSANVSLQIKPVADHVKAVEAKADKNTVINERQDERISEIDKAVTENSTNYKNIEKMFLRIEDKLDEALKK